MASINMCAPKSPRLTDRHQLPPGRGETETRMEEYDAEQQPESVQNHRLHAANLRNPGAQCDREDGADRDHRPFHRWCLRGGPGRAAGQRRCGGKSFVRDRHGNLRK